MVGVRLTIPDWATLPSSILPWLAVRLPPSTRISPPINPRVCPELTCNPIGRLLRRIVLVEKFNPRLWPFPCTWIVPGFLPNCTPGVILIVNNGGSCGSIALNLRPSPNTTLSAVEAKNEPPIFKDAFSPNTIPAGLIKNKFVVPFALIKPWISEIFPPVTRLKMLVISGLLLK